MASTQILAGVKGFLAQHPPFSQLTRDELTHVAQSVSLRYFEPGQSICGPEDGVPLACWIIKQGMVAVERDPLVGVVSTLATGDCFPVGALLAERAVLNTYRAAGDVFVFELPREYFHQLTLHNPEFLAFCKRRLGALLDLSQAQMRAAYASEASYTQTLHRPLGELVRRAALTCAPNTPLENALQRMQERDVGSILVVDDQQTPPVVGILTRTDLIAKIVLPRLPLEQPINAVMSCPVMTLQAQDTAADAAMLMALHGLRHVPVLDGTHVLGVVSERDLFALQRLSLRGIGDAIRQANHVDSLNAVSADVRALSRNLVAQGVGAAQITSLVSHLNDRLTQRLVEILAHEHQVDMTRICWIALGSEGREEQTIATDQDNGLIVQDNDSTDPARLAQFSEAVNHALAQAGFPLCKGNIMAANSAWRLSASAWSALFAQWITQGDPQHLLHASIFFDLRPLAGNRALASTLRAQIAQQAAANPRFLKQMSDNSLRNKPPAAWAGDWLQGLLNSEQAPVDLKLNGTVPLVDAARIFALSCGVTATNTVQRFNGCVATGRLAEADAHAWIDAFNYLQLLRLRHQHQHPEYTHAPNLIQPNELSTLDKRLLKESLRQARKAQQQLALDFPG